MRKDVWWMPCKHEYTWSSWTGSRGLTHIVASVTFYLGRMCGSFIHGSSIIIHVLLCSSLAFDVISSRQSPVLRDVWKLQPYSSMKTILLEGKRIQEVGLAFKLEVVLHLRCELTKLFSIITPFECIWSMLFKNLEVIDTLFMQTHHLLNPSNF
jgi:hypothetical protein